MKTSTSLISLRHFTTLIIFTLIQTVLWAQDSGGTESSSSTTTSTTKVRISEEQTTDWYTSPWVWIIGAAVFILLLVALLRGGGSNRSTHTDRVTYKEKVVRERDVDPDNI